MQTKTLQTKRALRTALLVLLLSAVGMGKMSAFTVDHLIYSVNDDNTTVTLIGHEDGTSATGSLVIPSSVTDSWYDSNGQYHTKTYTVTAIGDKAFTYCTGLTGALVIPNSVTTLIFDPGNGPTWGIFSGCTGFTSLVIGNSITEIPPYTFDGCSGFTGSLNLSNSLTGIGSCAFSGCSGFQGELVIPNSVTYLGSEAFKNCSGFTGDLIIPESTISIQGSDIDNDDGGAFYGCTGLNGTLVIPESVSYIGKNAFSGCRFTEVYFNAINCSDSYNAVGYGGPILDGSGGTLIIGERVQRIPKYLCVNTSFSGELILPNSVTEIGHAAFSRSGFTGNLIIPNSVTKIGQAAFHNCSGFTGNLIIPNSVTEIGPIAFEGCSGFTGNLIIPNSVTEINTGTFEGCNGFTGDLIIPNSVTEIWSEGFKDCTGLSGNLIIPNSVTYIGGEAFEGCSGFTGNLIIPNSVTAIGESAFQSCSGFTGNLIIPNSVTAIGESAFQSCSGFTGDLIIPNSIFYIDYYTFSNCNSFSRLVIGNSVQYIGTGAFLNCYGFSGDLIIPNSIAQIYPTAFLGCNNFDNCIVLGETPPELYYYEEYPIFDENITQLIIPCGCKTAYETSVWANYFTTIEEDCITHNIDINDISTNGGSVSVSSNSANLGDEVQITVTPDTGMSLSSLTVCNANDPSQTVPVYPIGKASSTYGFLMPPYDVEIKVVFKPGSAVDENSGIEVSVYPNPTNGLMKIEAEGIKSVCINNMLGQVIHEGKANGDVFEYDFGKHEAGVYLVRIETARGVTTKKVTVTK